MTSRSLVVALVVAAALASCSDAAPMSYKINDNFMMLKRIKLFDPLLSTTAKTLTVDQEFGELFLDAKNFTVNELMNSTGTLQQDAVTVDEDDDGDGDDDDDAAAATAAGTSDGDGTLSAVWYLAAFGGLVLFFFVVTCSELFLDNPVHARRQMDLPHAGYLRRHYLQRGAIVRRGRCSGTETPPPPYHLFAPPSYEDFINCSRLWTVKEVDEETKKTTPDDKNNNNNNGGGGGRLFVVPVHRGSAATFCSPKTPPEVVAEMTKQMNGAWKQNGKGVAED